VEPTPGDTAPDAAAAATNWPDETMESAFRAEALDRGEAVTIARLPVESDEETGTAPLPPLDDLVKRIPPHVRETLDDLFRARFVAVRRVPERALRK
jgi:hypothetical protein